MSAASDIATPSTNESLLVHIRDARDVRAWETFVDLYTPLVYRYSRRRGLQHADAQDATQEVFVQVSRAIRNFEYDPAKGRFRNWLGTLTFRAVGKQQRKASRQGRGAAANGAEALHSLAGDADPMWTEEFNAQVYEGAMKRIESSFDPLVWQAFQLTWSQNCPPAEVARKFGKTAAWVYKARYKVLKRLRAEIEFLAADVGLFQQD